MAAPLCAFLVCGTLLIITFHDLGDGLCLTFSLPDQPAQSAEFHLPKRAKSTLDYEPLARTLDYDPLARMEKD
jgi:hypothetical protein